METNHVRYRNTLCLRACVAALCLVSVTFAEAKGYVATSTPAVAGSTVQWTNAAIGKAQLSSAGAVVGATAPVAVNLATGVNVQVVATAAISGAAVGGAWGAAIYGLGAAALIAIPVIKARMDAAGVNVSGAGDLEGIDPNSHPGKACSTSGGWFTSYRPAQFGATGPDEIGYACYSPGDVHYGSIRADPTNLGTTAPLSHADAVSKMSMAAPTTAEVQALIDANFPPEVQPQAITGPSSVPVGNTVKLNSDGSKTEENCQFYLTYFPSNIKAHPECTVTTTIPEKTDIKQVTTTNPDGSTSTATVTTTTPASTKTEVITKDKIDEADKSECEQYPNRLECADIDTPDGEIPRESRSLTYEPESLGFGSGSCPANIVQTLNGQSVTVFSYTKPCQIISSYVAPLVLAISAWIALIILVPGAKTE